MFDAGSSSPFLQLVRREARFVLVPTTSRVPTVSSFENEKLLAIGTTDKEEKMRRYRNSEMVCEEECDL